jgi:threonine synthase
MARFSFRCEECGTHYHEHEVRYVCPQCSPHQEPGRETRGVLAVEIESLPVHWPGVRLTDPDALTAFLPIGIANELPPLPIGGTPLLTATRLGLELGVRHLWIKDDTRNPSGSTKDRASLLVVAKALEYGFDTIACASTGNAATALACVAAAAGVRAVVFVPAAAPPAKLVQIATYGAVLVPIAGSYDQAFELSLAASERFGFYNRNTAYNPFTIEGKKTVAIEIAAQLGEEEPDVVVVPTGDGVIVAGVAKGFADLVRAGLLRRAPRLLVVQPAGSAALATALRSGADAVSPVPNAHSVADSLVVSAPRNAIMALRTVRGTGGAAVVVDDEAIIAAIGRLARLTGVFAEPAAAAALAGLEAALAEGLVDRGERIVVLITGSGLKDIDAAARTVTRPTALPPDLDAVAQRLAALPSSVA